MQGAESCLKHMTRSGVGGDAQGKPRVYLSCHPLDLDRSLITGEKADRGRYLGLLAEDIFQSQNCAVYWRDPALPEPQTQEALDLLAADLSGMQLFVIPVTAIFLTAETCLARSYEYAVARRSRIPILPIAVEAGLAAQFTEVMNAVEPGFGDVQILDRTLTDLTAIPYQEKLRNVLDSILIGDDMARTVREAFNGHIFLSYRKKDREHARELMTQIHRTPGCEDISIWYDEFLVPGEKWSEAIRDAMDGSELVVFAVTENLLEEGNYVQEHEFPNARDAGKPLLPVIKAETDLAALKAIFRGMPQPVGDDADSLAQALEPLRQRVAGKEKVYAEPDGSRLKDQYLVGLAYLAAIDMERNTAYAVERITAAAREGLPVANAKLAMMYRTGDGVTRSMETSLYWQREYSRLRKELWEKGGAEEDGNELFTSLWEEGDLLMDIGRIGQARAVYEQMYVLAEQLRERFGLLRPLAVSCNQLGNAALAAKDTASAGAWYEEEYAVDQERLKVPTSAASDEWEAGKIRRDLAVCCTKRGLVLLQDGSGVEAETQFRRSLEIQEQLRKETWSLRSRRDIGVTFSNMGKALLAQGKPEEALPWMEKSLAVDEELLPENPGSQSRRDLATSCSLLGDVLLELGERDRALKQYRRSYVIRKALTEETGIPVDQQLFDSIREKLLSLLLKS